jgi:hypothetical protein
LSDTQTPGQIAYYAYCQSIYSDQAHPADYSSLAHGARAAWEAVAEAVLDAWQAQPRVETPKREVRS